MEGERPQPDTGKGQVMARKERTSGSETRQRTVVRTVRLTPEEAAQLDEKARETGITVGALIRHAALSVPVPRRSRRPPVELETLGRVLGQLGKIGSNINQLSKHANQGGVGFDDWRALKSEMEAIAQVRAAIMFAIGFDERDPTTKEGKRGS